jgi:hypothetical protein
MTKDVFKMENQDELSTKDREKVAKWSKNINPQWNAYLITTLKKLNNDDRDNEEMDKDNKQEQNNGILSKISKMDKGNPHDGILSKISKMDKGNPQYAKLRNMLIALDVFEYSESQKRTSGEAINSEKETLEQRKETALENTKTQDEAISLQEAYEDIETSTDMLSTSDNEAILSVDDDSLNKKTITREERSKLRSSIEQGKKVDTINKKVALNKEQQRDKLRSSLTNELRKTIPEKEIPSTQLKIFFEDIKQSQGTRKDVMASV